MVISVTDFKAHCPRILREVEVSKKPIEISKQGKVRVRIIPVQDPTKPVLERLKDHEALLAAPEETVVSNFDFDANK